MVYLFMLLSGFVIFFQTSDFQGLLVTFGICNFGEYSDQSQTYHQLSSLLCSTNRFHKKYFCKKFCNFYKCSKYVISFLLIKLDTYLTLIIYNIFASFSTCETFKITFLKGKTRLAAKRYTRFYPELFC